jgi:hypothetical protein
MQYVQLYNYYNSQWDLFQQFSRMTIIFINVKLETMRKTGAQK